MASSELSEVRRGAALLYITYDGLTDPLGRSQILPYLQGLAGQGHRITVLSCEKPDRIARDGERIRKLCADAGLGWHPLAYHRKPPVLSSVRDAAALERAAVSLHRRETFEIVHCRSYIPARAGLALKRRFGVRFLFDMRGFWPDEKAEGKNWNLRNPLYRAVFLYFKGLERRLLKGADHIVSLTEAGKDQLLTRREFARGGPPITVIPCCVDFAHFALASPELRSESRRLLGLDMEAPVVAYLGSLGSWYMLDEMLDFFRVYAERRPGARLLFITEEDAQPIREAAAARGVKAGSVMMMSAARENVPRMLAAADLGIFFIKPVFSKAASSPTKMAEMLAVGLPIITNSGVGDVEALVKDIGCGVAIRDFSPGTYDEAISALERLPGSPEERRRRALAWFDLETAIGRYDGVYRQLMSGSRAQQA